MTSILKPSFLNIKTVNSNYFKHIVIICETHFLSFIFQELRSTTVNTCIYGIITVNKSKDLKNNYLSQNMLEIFIKCIK